MRLELAVSFHFLYHLLRKLHGRIPQFVDREEQVAVGVDGCGFLRQTESLFDATTFEGIPLLFFERPSPVQVLVLVLVSVLVSALEMELVLL